MAVLLPEFAKLLLAKDGPNGPLAHLGMTSLVDSDGFEPSSRQQVELTPADNTHAVIVYHISYGQTPLYTFSVDIQHRGAYAFSGRLTEEDVAGGHDLWAPVTRGAPLIINVANDDTVVFHVFRIRLHYLVVNTKTNYDAIQKVLAAYRGPGEGT